MKRTWLLTIVVTLGLVVAGTTMAGTTVARRTMAGTTVAGTSESGASRAAATAAPDYPNAELLVDVRWLADHLGDSDLLVIDMRERARFRESHVPQGVNLPVADIVTTVAGVSFEFEPARVEAALRAIGLRSDHTVVIYDDLGMMNAARLFWTLEYVGHENVRVLDGGWDAWLEAGERVESGQATAVGSEYVLEVVPERLITADELVSRLGEPDLAIADARSREEYVGSFKYGARGGRIPGAVHLPWFDALRGGDTAPTTTPGWAAELADPDVEYLESAAELRAWLEAAGVTPDKQVVTYCQTFWRGAHLYFVLRLMGYDDVRGYDGSWAEWGNRLDLPRETGEPGR